MVLKLYGSPFSTYTRLALVVAKELGIEYEFINIDLAKQENLKPEYKAYQPFSQVPCIDDDGFILYESRAIARYLVAKVKSHLLPTDLKAAAAFEQAASIENNAFDQPAGRIWLERFIKGVLLKQEPNEAIVNEALGVLSKNLDVYEGILSKTKYLAGNQITLADLFHLPMGTSLSTIGINVLSDPSRPNVARWWNEISSRPSWSKVRAML